MVDPWWILVDTYESMHSSVSWWTYMVDPWWIMVVTYEKEKKKNRQLRAGERRGDRGVTEPDLEKS